MNVIFLDFDGVLTTIHSSSLEDVEKRIALLASICKQYDCKVVIEAAAKDCIDEVTLEVYGKWVKFIFKMFKKYGIECIGRTPNVTRRYNNGMIISMHKGEEIRLYLMRHPEIDHYCVIDDDDLFPHSDLDNVRDHLVTTKYYSRNIEEEGLLESHRKEIGKVLKRENHVKKLMLKYHYKTDKLQ